MVPVATRKRRVEKRSRKIENSVAVAAVAGYT
jgi:hypothetical protein